MEQREQPIMTLADQIAEWIAEHVRGAGMSGVVVGLSGGLDSAVTSGLCARAVGADQVLGVIMPCHSDPSDAESAELAAKTWGIPYRTVDLSDQYDSLLQLLSPARDLAGSDTDADLSSRTRLADANLKPRLRMMTLYYFANMLNRMVVGTGNKSELTVGYFTKYGDGGVDLLPIAGIHKTRLRELAREMGVPEVIVTRTPSAGLWAGQTDEGEMGISYETLAHTLDAIESGATSEIDPATLEKVRGMVAGSEHKRQLPPIFQPDATSI